MEGTGRRCRNVQLDCFVVLLTPIGYQGVGGIEKGGRRQNQGSPWAFQPLFSPPQPPASVRSGAGSPSTTRGQHPPIHSRRTQQAGRGLSSLPGSWALGKQHDLIHTELMGDKPSDAHWGTLSPPENSSKAQEQGSPEL